jgi:FkbM family methyltransferase
MFKRFDARAQGIYLSKIVSQLGLAGGVRARALTWANKKFGTNRLVRLKPDCVLHPVLVRPGTTDADTYFQVLIEKQYSIVPDICPMTIVDCGANAGYTSAYFLSRFPLARVIAIEPSAGNAAICRENLAPYGNRATVLEAAIWSEAGILVLDATDGNEWGVQVRVTEQCETGGVKAINIADLGLPKIDLLKIDIEGSEKVLFQSRADRWLPSVGSIVIELHGPDCEAAFTEALSGYDYKWHQQGELSLAVGLQMKTCADPV